MTGYMQSHMPSGRRAVVCAVALLSLASPMRAGADQADAAGLSGDWVKIGSTGVCSTGAPYHFLARRGASDSLMIYFNGGGACWTGQLCDPELEPNMHVASADLPVNDPRNFGGLFDLDHAANPFRDYSMVFLPYCTGDMHVGGGVQVYDVERSDSGADTVKVHHAGHDNSAGVLEWVYRTFPAPDRVFVTGHSAGAVGASFHAGGIAARYPQTPVVVLGDAAGGYDSPSLSVWFDAWKTAAILPDWPEYEGETAATLTFEDFYIASAGHAANLTIAQVNHIADRVQLQYTLPLGEEAAEVSIPTRIMNHYAEIEAAAGQLHRFTASGDNHEILPAHEFYSTVVQGAAFHEWIGALAAGGDVADASCLNQQGGCD